MCTGTHAIGDSSRLLRTTKLIFVCGGAEAAICPLYILFSAARLNVNTFNENSARSRPWDKDRSGFAGRGAGVLVWGISTCKKKLLNLWRRQIWNVWRCFSHSKPQKTKWGYRAMEMALKESLLNVDDRDM